MQPIPSDKKLKTPPYPHSIAYENLVASCKGKICERGASIVLHQCCNNFRGNKRIIPMFFIREISSQIEYRKDGTLNRPEKYDETIHNLNLEHPSLVFIRRIWASIVSVGVTVKDVQAALTDKQLRSDIISDIGINWEERSKLRNQVYWNLLNEFYWFHDYYQNKFNTTQRNFHP